MCLCVYVFVYLFVFVCLLLCLCICLSDVCCFGVIIVSVLEGKGYIIAVLRGNLLTTWLQNGGRQLWNVTISKE